MELKHTITVYRLNSSTKTWGKSAEYENVYWYGSEVNKLSGHGIETSYAYKVIIPHLNADILVNDIVLKGSGPEITSKADLAGYSTNIFTVRGLDYNDAGSVLDHIFVYGD